ncbi:GNRHR [Branchiostoma lanceolatum]|uniref:GNRHR protein n=1 Tax=Branchiostoma lanceolatum TaxID=7740 RepID=A0A8J9ZGV1_BRALA|nr:GNRHR [Branchiostoma lanceolatum]
MCRDAAQRRKHMVAVCWILSILFSIPQAVIFHVESPVPNFQQCVTFGFYTAKWQEQLYNGLVLVVMYPVPLLAILVCSALTFIRLKKEGQDRDTFGTRNPTRERLLLKARNNTLRTTAGIMAGFILCWTPYFVTMVWILFFNWQMVSPVVFDVLFLFGIFNSCVNPVVYGLSMFKGTTHRPTLSLIEFSSPFLTRSERRSASVYSRISRSYSHVSLSTRRSWQPSTDSPASPRPDALNGQHSNSASPVTSRYGASSRARRRSSRQKFLHPDTPKSLESSALSTKHWSDNTAHLKITPLTRTHSSPCVLTSAEVNTKCVRPNRRQSTALTVPVLPIICLTPPPESRNTEFVFGSTPGLHDEHACAISSTRPPVADMPYQTAMENQDGQYSLSRQPSKVSIASTPDTPGWETTPCQFVGKTWASPCRYDSSSSGLPSASYQGTRMRIAGLNICLGNTGPNGNPTIPEEHHAESAQNARNDAQETRVIEDNSSSEAVSSPTPLPRLSIVESSCGQTGGASILCSDGSVQSVFESPLHSPSWSPVCSVDFRHRLSLCSFREGRPFSDPYSALPTKHYSADNLKLSSQNRKAKRRVSKTVRFLDQSTVSNSSLSSEGSNSTRSETHQETKPAKKPSGRRASLADIKSRKGCRVKRKISSILP